MNYNDYDSGNNKKGFDISEIINDKQQRSRFFLFIYLIIFILLIVFIRVNTNSNKVEKEKEETNNNENSVISEDTELDKMFSFIDMNNYDFNFDIKINDSYSVITGKRYNNNYSFELKNNEDILYFSGTSNNIRAKNSVDGEFKDTGFPYLLINYFDTKVLKKLINSSTINNNIYEISNEEIGKIVNKRIPDGELINTIELIKSNNKIVQINLLLSNVVSSYTKETSEAIITLKYGNFGLVDDFKIE